MSFSRIFILGLFILPCNFIFHALTEETIAGLTPSLNNGFAVSQNGDIYASDIFRSEFNGNNAYRILSHGTRALNTSGLSQSPGFAFDLYNNWTITYYFNQAFKVSEFPNPAFDFTTKNYQIHSDNFVKLELYGDNGLFLKDIFS